MTTPHHQNRRFRPQLLQLEDRFQPSASPYVLQNQSGYLSDSTQVNGELFYTDGEDLWKTDGTVGGTSLVKAFPASESGVTSLTNVNGTLFFLADDVTHGQQLWTSDGTASGTIMLTDIQIPLGPPVELPIEVAGEPPQSPDPNGILLR
jgi:ELWxxDGT repeat protein